MHSAFDYPTTKHFHITYKGKIMLRFYDINADYIKFLKTKLKSSKQIFDNGKPISTIRFSFMLPSFDLEYKISGTIT